jgi:hypothetical protein
MPVAPLVLRLMLLELRTLSQEKLNYYLVFSQELYCVTISGRMIDELEGNCHGVNMALSCIFLEGLLNTTEKLNLYNCTNFLYFMQR